MKRLTLVAALAAAAIAVPLGIGSSHREAPLTALDPTGDDTDVYAFTAKDDPASKRNEEHRLTVVANWIPFEDPAGGPNFYRFDDRADYYINVDNNGDGRADVRYKFKFKTHVRNPNSFLYAAPPVKSINDPNLNVYQTYDITREGTTGAESSRKGHRAKKRHQARRHHRRGKHHGKSRSSDNPRSIVIAQDYPVAPNNVGPKTFPDYNAVANQAIKDVRFPGEVGKVFVGQRDDPFFVDLGTTFDAVNFRVGTGAQGGGKDDLAGYGVHSVVLQIPEGDITRDGNEVSSPKQKDAVVGVWASTERPKLQVTDTGEEGRGGDVQVSRLGNPLVNEVVIPLGQKDRFNRTSPADDAKNFGQFVVNPELARLMNALFNLGVKETGRTDIVQALLQGIPGLNQQSGKPVDTLKINLGTPPSTNPSRLGVLGNDLAGFPNGRRLTDDVVDIELRVVEGILLDPPAKRDVPLGDGVDQNDKPFSDKFPYLAPPTSGFDAALKCAQGPPCARTYPTHAPE